MRKRIENEWRLQDPTLKGQPESGRPGRGKVALPRPSKGATTTTWDPWDPEKRQASIVKLVRKRKKNEKTKKKRLSRTDSQKPLENVFHCFFIFCENEKKTSAVENEKKTIKTFSK